MFQRSDYYETFSKAVKDKLIIVVVFISIIRNPKALIRVKMGSKSGSVARFGEELGSHLDVIQMCVTPILFPLLNPGTVSTMVSL